MQDRNEESRGISANLDMAYSVIKWFYSSAKELLKVTKFLSVFKFSQNVISLDRSDHFLSKVEISHKADTYLGSLFTQSSLGVENFFKWDGLSDNFVLKCTFGMVGVMEDVYTISGTNLPDFSNIANREAIVNDLELQFGDSRKFSDFLNSIEGADVGNLPQIQKKFSWFKTDIVLKSIAGMLFDIVLSTLIALADTLLPRLIVASGFFLLSVFYSSAAIMHIVQSYASTDSLLEKVKKLQTQLQEKRAIMSRIALEATGKGTLVYEMRKDEKVLKQFRWLLENEEGAFTQGTTQQDQANAIRALYAKVKNGKEWQMPPWLWEAAQKENDETNQMEGVDKRLIDSFALIADLDQHGEGVRSKIESKYTLPEIIKKKVIEFLSGLLSSYPAKVIVGTILYLALSAAAVSYLPVVLVVLMVLLKPVIKILNDWIVALFFKCYGSTYLHPVRQKFPLLDLWFSPLVVTENDFAATNSDRFLRDESKLWAAEQAGFKGLSPVIYNNLRDEHVASIYPDLLNR